MSETKTPIICGICGEEITPMSRKIPPQEREYKADMVISRDAYWNDAGIFSIMRTRRFFHKECFEYAIRYERIYLEYKKTARKL